MSDDCKVHDMPYTHINTRTHEFMCIYCIRGQSSSGVMEWIEIDHAKDGSQ